MTDRSMSGSDSLPSDADPPPETDQPIWQRLVWPGIIFYLLGGQVLLILLTVYLATRDRSFAVEPNYYQQALRWDGVKAQETANRQLGWTIAIDVGHDVNVRGERSVTCTLRDRSGQPLEEALIDLVAFAHARGNDRYAAVLQPCGGGQYSARLRTAPARDLGMPLGSPPWSRHLHAPAVDGNTTLVLHHS